MEKEVAADKVSAGLRYAVVCPNITGRIKGRNPQSKRARAGLLVIVDQPQVARTCILRAFFGLKMSCCLSLALITFFFILFRLRLFTFIEVAALSSIIFRY